MAPPWMRVSERWSQRSLRSLRMVCAETSKRLARSSTITRPKARAILRISVWRWDSPAIAAPRSNTPSCCVCFLVRSTSPCGRQANQCRKNRFWLRWSMTSGHDERRASMKSAVWIAGALCMAASLLISPHGKAQTGTAPVLKVETAWPKGTGTTHYADELRLSAGASAALVLKTDPGGGKLIPVPGPQYPVDDTHVLLLGWSSHGGGMQTIHALLLRVENDTVTLQRELMLTMARNASALIVRRDGPNQI